jgi:hypothetical protein
MACSKTSWQEAGEVLANAGMEEETEAALAAAMPAAEQARLYHTLGDAYSKREQTKTDFLNYQDFMKVRMAAEAH